MKILSTSDIATIAAKKALEDGDINTRRNRS